MRTRRNACCSLNQQLAIFTCMARVLHGNIESPARTSSGARALAYRFLVNFVRWDMESPVVRMVRDLIRTRSPDLYADLESKGELEHYIYYRVAAISSEVDLQRRKEKWDFLPHREMIAKLNDAREIASKRVLKELQAA